MNKPKKQYNFNPDTKAVVVLKNNGNIEEVNCLLSEVNDVIRGKKWIKFYAITE